MYVGTYVAPYGIVSDGEADWVTFVLPMRKGELR